MTDTPVIDPADENLDPAGGQIEGAVVVDPTVTPAAETIAPLASDTAVTATTPPVSLVASAPEASTVSEDEPDDASDQATPPFVPSEVTPTASETPVPAESAPIEHPDVLIPTNGSFGDSREIAAAERLALDTPAGKALSAGSREILRGLETAFQGIESWINHARTVISKLPETP